MTFVFTLINIKWSTPEKTSLKGSSHESKKGVRILKIFKDSKVKIGRRRQDTIERQFLSCCASCIVLIAVDLFSTVVTSVLFFGKNRDEMNQKYSMCGSIPFNLTLVSQDWSFFHRSSCFSCPLTRHEHYKKRNRFAN